MTISVGEAIYIGVKPLTKVFLNSAIGFVLARKDVITQEVSQAVSILIVNILAPCLVFNKILLSLGTKDIVAIAVMLLTAILYTALGLGFAMLVKAVTPNPKYWFGGLIVAGMFTNSGDLPIAYITTLSGGTSFHPRRKLQGNRIRHHFHEHPQFFSLQHGRLQLHCTRLPPNGTGR